MKAQFKHAEQSVGSELITFITDKGYETATQLEVETFITERGLNVAESIERTWANDGGLFNNPAHFDTIETEIDPAAVLDDRWEEVTEMFYNEKWGK